MKKLICIGDSNTYGFDPRGFMGGRYPMPWTELFQSATGVLTANLGQNGMEIPSDEFEMELLDWNIRRKLPADAMTVMLGTNDLLNACRPNVDIITGRMRDFLLHLKEHYPTVKLYLLAVPPVTITERGLKEAAEKLNRRYAQLAEELKVSFIDTAAWKLGIAYDGVHLTEEAHHRFAESLIQCVYQGYV